MASQKIRPNGDVSIASWTAHNGDTTNIYQYIDDESLNGYIMAPLDSGVAIFDLQSPDETPAIDTGHSVVAVAEKFTTSGRQITMSLLQGGTTIASDSFNLSTSPQTITLNVTSGEAANISNYAALRISFELSGSNNPTAPAGVFYAYVLLPGADEEPNADVGTITFSGVEGESGVNLYIDGSSDVGTVTFSSVDGTADTSTPISTYRDVFTTWNPTTREFHVGQIDMTHNVSAGSGPSSAVEFQHFVLGVDNRELYRFKYDDCYASGFVGRNSLTTTEVGGAYFDRPDSVILGFWSYGAWPDLDNPNTTITYELSIPKDHETVPDTNGYPFYGSTQPSEEVYLVLGANEEGDPFTVKRFKRLWLWIIPPPDADDTLTIVATVYCHPTNAQGNMGRSVQRTVTVSGYHSVHDPFGVVDTSGAVRLSQPVKMAYIDFDPFEDPEAGTGSPTGTAFELKVQFSTAIGVWRLATEIEMGGEIRYLEYQEP